MVEKLQEHCVEVRELSLQAGDPLKDDFVLAHAAAGRRRCRWTYCWQAISITFTRKQSSRSAMASISSARPGGRVRTTCRRSRRFRLLLFAEAASPIGVRPEHNEWRFYRMEVWPDQGKFFSHGLLEICTEGFLPVRFLTRMRAEGTFASSRVWPKRNWAAVG